MTDRYGEGEGGDERKGIGGQITHPRGGGGENWEGRTGGGRERQGPPQGNSNSGYGFFKGKEGRKGPRQWSVPSLGFPPSQRRDQFSSVGFLSRLCRIVFG